MAQWWAWLRARFKRAPQSLGDRGEAAAAKFLKRLGYRIVATQARSQLGELDLIAVDGRTIVFVEVRTRSDTQHGSPLETVDLAKQKRLTRVALGYLKRHRLLNHSCRFDVVSVVWPSDSNEPQIEHIRDAFPATGFDGMYS